MGKSNDLKGFIQSKLESVCEYVSHRIAKNENLYPHIVFKFNNINLGDLWRDDVVIDIDLWDKGQSTSAIDDMADEVEVLFDSKNEPQENILPTFFLIDRKTVPDEDKSIHHILIRVQVQNYER